MKDNDGDTALHRTVYRGHTETIEIVKLLISAEIDINVTNNNGTTALIRAAQETRENHIGQQIKVIQKMSK